MDFNKLESKLNGLDKAVVNGKIVNNLSNIVNQDEIWFIAYNNLSKNDGFMTSGVDRNTPDGSNKYKILKIRDEVKSGIFKPTSVRRVYIPKGNGQMRELGIPSFKDKLVQEVFRIILERIYEPYFSDYSHGFRRNRSCHTALEQMKIEWKTIKWFIRFDIKKCFDTIDHNIMLSILKERISDKKFINIINEFLKSGYTSNWKYHKTYSGAPQGSIISPILSNIYMDKLDEYMQNMINDTNIKNERNINPEYKKYESSLRRCKTRISENSFIVQSFNKEFGEIDDLFVIVDEYYNRFKEAPKNSNLRAKYLRYLNDQLIIFSNNIHIEYRKLKQYYISVKTLSEDNMIINRIKESLRLIPYRDQYDPDFRRIRYCRYADDFVVGYVGSLKECKIIMTDIIKFLDIKLNLKISDEKSKICNSHKSIRFLGYDIKKWNYKKARWKINNVNNRQKVGSMNLKFNVPIAIRNNFIISKGYCSGNLEKPIHRTQLLNNDELEILLQYNSELRGLFQYYKLADDAKDKIMYVQYFNHYSFFKTLSAKYQISMPKIIRNHCIYVNGSKEYIWKFMHDGKYHEYKLFKLSHIQDKYIVNNYNPDYTPNTLVNMNKTSLIKRLETKICEICGNETDDIELHHIRKLSSKFSNKKYTEWQKIMIGKNSKTISVCVKCHNNITKQQNKSKLKF